MNLCRRYSKFPVYTFQVDTQNRSWAERNKLTGSKHNRVCNMNVSLSSNSAAMEPTNYSFYFFLMIVYFLI